MTYLFSFQMEMDWGNFWCPPLCCKFFLVLFLMDKQHLTSEKREKKFSNSVVCSSSLPSGVRSWPLIMLLHGRPVERPLMHNVIYSDSGLSLWIALFWLRLQHYRVQLVSFQSGPIENQREHFFCCTLFLFVLPAALQRNRMRRRWTSGKHPPLPSPHHRQQHFLTAEPFLFVKPHLSSISYAKRTICNWAVSWPWLTTDSKHLSIQTTKQWLCYK